MKTGYLIKETHIPLKELGNPYDLPYIRYIGKHYDSSEIEKATNYAFNNKQEAYESFVQILRKKEAERLMRADKFKDLWDYKAQLIYCHDGYYSVL